MLENLIQLTVLFLVIVDPLASLVVFITSTKNMTNQDRHKIATLAILVASGLSFSVLFLGNGLLDLFSTSVDEFRIAGGIILGILGIKMALGIHLGTESEKNNSSRAIAAIIGTPLLTGPATITAIIVSLHDYGRLLTGLALLIVLLITTIIFYASERVTRYLGVTAIQIMSTVLGLITLAWGVKFIVEGVHAIFQI